MEDKKRIYILTDYKNNFGSKWKSLPYRSGLDKNLLSRFFLKEGFCAEFINFSTVDLGKQNWADRIVLYTSSEDSGLYYKSYIEDIILGLELHGANVIPKYEYLRSHENKVMMELIKTIYLKELGLTDRKSTNVFGCLDELKRAINDNLIQYPCVIKSSNGSMSKGVRKAENQFELLKIAKRFSKTFNIKLFIEDLIRKKRHLGYIMESTHRKKFIVQPMIEKLENDWKVLVYGDFVYVLKRDVRKNDFRASGSHINYKSGSDSGITGELLNYARSIYLKLNLPFVSLDLAFDGTSCCLLEFQAIYFGTSTHFMSKDYFVYKDNGWQIQPNTLSQEEVFVKSVVGYYKRNEGSFCL